MKALRILFISVCIFSAVGCANIYSIHRNFDVGNGKGAFIDIKQRAVIVSKRGGTNGHPVVCAEPSPDALASYAAELATSGKFPSGASAEIAAGFQESAGFTGLRTQSIQLLRDSFYRICEAYLNEAITEEQYDLLIRRYQKYTVALLAIEQLTGTVRMPSIVIATSGEAQSSPINEILNRIDENDARIADYEAKKAEISKKPEAERTPDEKKAVAAADSEISKLKNQNKTLSDALKNVAEGKIAIKSVSQQEEVKGESKQFATDPIATAVQAIVEGVTQTDDFIQLCMIHYENRKTAQTTHSQRSKDLEKSCEARLKIANDTLGLQHKVAEAQLRLVSDTKMPTDEKVKLLRAMGETITYPGSTVVEASNVSAASGASSGMQTRKKISAGSGTTAPGLSTQGKKTIDK